MELQTAPNRTAGRSWVRIATGAIGAAACLLGHSALVQAFPLVDPTNDATVPAGIDLAAPDQQDLAHQLKLANGMPAAGQGGWTVVPRLSLQEALTDNLLQLPRPRRWDLTSYISPEISIVGETQRAQLRLDYAPVLIMNARTGSENALNQQLNATGLITVIQDLAFIDLRALAGVQSTNGGIGGQGGLGASSLNGITAGSASFNSSGVSRNQQTQTESYGASPYLLHRFGDYGTAKLGYSVDVSRFNTVNGFTYLPVPTGSNGAQDLLTTEQIAQFTSGDYFNFVQDQLTVDLTQSHSSFATGQTTASVSTTTPVSGGSTRQIITNNLSYAVNHAIAINLSGGHENIHYSGNNRLAIDDMTWSAGVTYTPNPDTMIRLSYGHQEGANSISFDGRYALTARTVITASYNDTLGTELENVQRQLNLATVGPNGTLVNSATGGLLFTGNNANGVQAGIFHFHTLTSAVSTALERDTLSLSLTLSDQTSAGAGAPTGASSTSETGSFQWIRQMRPDLTFSSSVSYSLQSGGVTGTARSLAFNAGLQYTLSDTVSSTLRYTFYDRTSPVAAFNTYQNLLIVGITKQF